MRLASVLSSALSCLVLLSAIPLVAQQVAATPPMGWNSWNHFADKVTDADVRTAADQLVSTGMKDAGYIYVNVDDTWQGTRDAQGVLHTNDRFPDMKALADYVHSKGLKFGIYSSPGMKTCGGYEGSYHYEQQDADLYASWGVDFLKYDLCSFNDNLLKAAAAHPDDSAHQKAELKRTMMIAAYSKMGDALKAATAKTGRPIFYSLCQYGVDQPWKWGPGVGAQMWRTTDDIDDTYGRMIAIGFSQAGLSKYGGPGHWNDPDMLEVGNGHMTEDEYKTHMSLWVLLAAPLLAGNDLSKMSESDKSILMNKEAIAIDQDSLGKQGDRLYESGDLDVWTKPLSGGRVAVGLFNRSWSTRDVSVNLADLGFKSGASLRDVWKHQDLGHQSGIYTETLPKHAAALFIVSR